MRPIRYEEKCNITFVRIELRKMAEKEGFRLYRLARKAREKGVPIRTVQKIRAEAHTCLTTLVAYPGRMLDIYDMEANFEYAFK